MSYTINDLALTEAQICLPLTGAWTADVTISPVQGDTAAALAGQVTIDLGVLELTGHVVRSDPSDGAAHARIVGGAGGLSSVLVERYYKGSSTLRKIAGDIARESGETIAAASSAVVLDRIMPTWQRAREPAGIALTRILETVGGNWRVTPTGELLIVGAESWPVVAPAFTLVSGSQPQLGIYRVAWPEDPPAEVLPGVTFLDRRIRYVSHELSAAGLRSELRTVEPRAFLDRLRNFAARDVWYARQWSAVVDKQNADGTIDVIVAGSFGESQVPIRHGLPGVAVLVQQGQQVLVGYENGDPKLPFASLWKTGGTAKIGTLLTAQNALSFALLPPQWFAAGPVGDAAAAVALAAVLSAGNVGYLTPITTPIVEAS